MARIIAVHELDLKPGADRAAFERVVQAEIADLGLHMPGLVERRFLRGYLGERDGEYAMLLVLESVAAMEALYGPRDALRRGPAAFVHYEDAIAPFLSAATPI